MFVVVMETLKYVWVPSFSSKVVWFESLRSEEVVIYMQKCPEAIFVDGCHGNAKYTRIPNFASIHCMVCKFER